MESHRRLKSERDFSFIVLLAIVTLTGRADGAETQSACSPVIQNTHGNVAVTFAGGCTVGLSAAQLKEITDSLSEGRTIPGDLLDSYERISEQLGVTVTAVRNFFQILGKEQVPTDRLEAKFKEIAAEHLILLRRAQISNDDGSEIVSLKKRAHELIEIGDYVSANKLLQQVFDVEIAAARRAQEAADSKRLNSH